MDFSSVLRVQISDQSLYIRSQSGDFNHYLISHIYSNAEYDISVLFLPQLEPTVGKLESAMGTFETVYEEKRTLL